MTVQETSKIQGIQVISRAADILRVLGEDPRGLSLGQIASRVELPRSTVQRIISALTLEGFVSTSGSHGSLRLGPEIQNLARASAADAKDRLRPLMQRISDETGETVDLAVLESGRMRFIDQVVGTQRLRTVSSIGEAFPLTSTANGKAALACMDADEVAEVARREQGAAPSGALLDEIAKIRAGALARDEDEHTDGVSALGFAVRVPGGEIYAISVPVPSSRFARVKDALAQVLAKARIEAAN